MNASIDKEIVLVLLMIGASALPLRAQETDLSPRFRLAQNFEQAGEWERAIALYEQLLEAEPQNYMFFDGLRRGYTNLKKYDKAIDLVRQRLTIQKDDINLLAIMGGLYYQSGSAQAADSLWNIVIEGDRKNSVRYRLVASQMIEFRLYEKAIRIYLAARIATENMDQFVEELALLYAALQQYEEATHEYVRMLRSKPQQLSYVQARIAAFTGREEGRKAAIKVARQEVRRSPNDLSFHALLAWLYIEGKEFDSALSEYRIIDRLSNADGGELFQFAQRAMQEQAYPAAARAFREVVDEHPEHRMIPYARFGFARAVEELSIGSDTLTGIRIERPTGLPQTGMKDRAEPVSETRPSFQGAMSLYEALVSDYPGSDVAMQAFYRIGTIRYQRFFDLDGALSAFDGLRAFPLSSPLQFEATVSSGEVYTAKGDLLKARREYLSLLPTAREQQRDQILFRLAELDYFEAGFDTALARLKGITSNVNTDLANDALQLQYFIQENKASAQVALSEFAAADLLMRQHKYSESLSRFIEITRAYPPALLLDDGMMRLSELHLLLHQAGAALEVLRQVANEMPSSILRDKAQLRIGEVYEKVLKNDAKAIEAYEGILIKYPSSLYVEEARKRIRLLRGDTI